jgi:hypothetical protein
MLLVAALGLAVMTAGCGSDAGRIAQLDRGLNFGAFSGYQRFGSTRSVGATLTVPRLNPGPELAAAGTWIGAEAIGAGGSREPFIQVGVNEVSVGGILPGSHTRAVYYVFWSDTANHFHPLPLFEVHAGDQVATSLALRDHRWRITVADGTTHRSFDTTQEGHGVFQMAVWAQEDVTENTRTMRLSPYPDVASPVMSSLSVNGRAPTQASLNATWMSVRGAILSPTPLHDDSFSLTQKSLALTPHQIAFLGALATANTKRAKVVADLYRVTAQTPRTLIRRWASQLSAHIAHSEHVLRSQRWFGDADSKAAALIIKDEQRVASLTDAIRDLPASDYGRWRARWSSSVGASIAATARLLRALGVPEIPRRPTPST